MVTRRLSKADAFGSIEMGSVDGNHKRREKTMILRWLLLETRLGALFLTLLERRAGLALVSAEWLGAQIAGVPKVLEGEQ